MRQGLHRILVVAAALWASTPSRGDACVNAVLATDKTVSAVKEAEKILADGDPAEALRRIRALLGQDHDLLVPRKTCVGLRLYD